MGEVKLPETSSLDLIIALDAALAELPKDGQGLRALAILCQGTQFEDEGPTDASEAGRDRRKRGRTQGFTSATEAQKFFQSGGRDAAMATGAQSGVKPKRGPRPPAAAADASVSARWGCVTFLQV